MEFIFRFRFEGTGEMVMYSDGTPFGPFRSISEAFEELDNWQECDLPSDVCYVLVQEPLEADQIIPWAKYPWRIVA